MAFALDPQSAATLAELERQHAQLNVSGWLTLSALGGISLVMTIGLMVPGAMMVQHEPCGF